MADFKIGDKVRIKDRKNWPTPPGYPLANTEGKVVPANWVTWEEMTADFPDYVYVKIEKCKVTDYIGNTFPFRIENVEKL